MTTLQLIGLGILLGTAGVITAGTPTSDWMRLATALAEGAVTGAALAFGILLLMGVLP